MDNPQEDLAKIRSLRKAIINVLARCRHALDQPMLAGESMHDRCEGVYDEMWCGLVQALLANSHLTPDVLLRFFQEELTGQGAIPIVGEVLDNAHLGNRVAWRV